MTIQEAIKSHKRFRRAGWTAGDKPEWLGTDFHDTFGDEDRTDRTGRHGYDIHRVGADGYLIMHEYVTLQVVDILADDWMVPS